MLGKLLSKIMSSDSQLSPSDLRSFRQVWPYCCLLVTFVFADGRDLLYQEYETSGGRLQYPVGCYHLEDWLLDSLNVPKLLLHLKTGPLAVPHIAPYSERCNDWIPACCGPNVILCLDL